MTSFIQAGSDVWTLFASTISVTTIKYTSLTPTVTFVIRDAPFLLSTLTIIIVLYTYISSSYNVEYVSQLKGTLVKAGCQKKCLKQ